MSEARINLLALRRLFSEEEWTRLTQIAAFTELAQNLQSTDDIKKAAGLALELLEKQKAKVG